MYKLEATDTNGKALELANGKAIDIAMPSNNMQTGMNVFVSNNGSDWVMTEQEPLTVKSEFDLQKGQ